MSLEAFPLQMQNKLSSAGNKIYNVVIPNTGFIQNPDLEGYLGQAKKKGINVVFDDGNTSFEGYDLYMLMNTQDEDFETSVCIPCGENDSFCFVNPENLETQDIITSASEKGAKIEVKFDPLSPVIICKY